MSFEWPAATEVDGADDSNGEPPSGTRPAAAGVGPSGAVWAPGGHDSAWPGWPAGASGWEHTPLGEPEPDVYDPWPADPLSASPDHTDRLPPVDPEGRARPLGAFFGADGAYAPEAPYGAARGPDSLGVPSVWGASSYEPGSSYPFGGYDEAGSHPASHIHPPIFPGDPDIESDGASGRRHAGWTAAVLGALILVGGGIAAALSLGGSHPTPAVSLAPTSLSTRAAQSTVPTTAAGAHQTVPATTSPTTTLAPTTTTLAPSTTTLAPSTTTPTTPPPTTPPTTTATVTLSSWTSQELDLILQIKTDLTTLNRDLYGQPDFSILTIDATDLQQDLRAAQGAPKPADTAVGQEWSQLLSDLAASNSDLDGAIRTQDPHLAQDLQQPVATTDTDYNNLSKTLNYDARQGSFAPGGDGQGAESNT